MPGWILGPPGAHQESTWSQHRTQPEPSHSSLRQLRFPHAWLTPMVRTCAASAARAGERLRAKAPAYAGGPGQRERPGAKAPAKCRGPWPMRAAGCQGPGECRGPLPMRAAGGQGSGECRGPKPRQRSVTLALPSNDIASRESDKVDGTCCGTALTDGRETFLLPTHPPTRPSTNPPSTPTEATCR